MFERDSLAKDRAWHSEYSEEIVGRFMASGSKRIAVVAQQGRERESLDFSFLVVSASRLDSWDLVTSWTIGRNLREGSR